MDSDGSSSLLLQILVLLLLTLLNAFFAAAEIAVISVDDDKINDRVEKGDKTAKKIKKFRDDQSMFLSTIQVGITFANFFSSAFAATSISERLGAVLTNIGLPYGDTIALVAVTLILSYITLVFGELVPKRLALQQPEKVSNFVIGPIDIFARISSFFISFLSFSTNTVLRILGVDLEETEEQMTLEDLNRQIMLGVQHGVINPVEKEIIHSVIVFDDKQAEDIMTARTEVFAIDINKPLEDHMEEILTLKYSRIPVYEEDIDSIIGILYIKDILKAIYEHNVEDLNVRSILRDPYFVPETKNISELFVELKENRNHFAVLIDEYGGFTGIVTMEDLIEEIVGEIDDEYDSYDPDIYLAKETEDYKLFVAKGSMTIMDINSEIGTYLNEDVEEYDSVAGLIIDDLGYIPDEGERACVQVEGIEFCTLEIEDNKIQRVSLEIPHEYFLEEENYDYSEEDSEEASEV